ncbi:MAG TPA: two pore domain potassium channel family protein [Hyphomonas atlantica]|uniref:Two pore domain potassium channel family protein n=1 Tax=Hyphomonas atlantica TaxID=1280948 RepID=A0A356W801_9PROT|nr:transporter [Magnetovibrio sp.]MAY65800.1 transporter [Rhodospirillaceae bacterium]HBQ49148.1 two pore domain potassium channel family protein [Hyphomonas atlantica]|tara:strand:- start:1694 stop:2152 length:459 start_codon:yes stop_codon:yes gene_type:complete
MGAAVGMSVFLVITTFLLHYAVFRWLSGGMSNIAMTAERRILIIWLLTLSAHVVEVALYAAAYVLGERMLEIGSLEGLQIVGPLDYFYFSIVAYTSLGMGDIVPSDHLRFITGIETLNGLLLIAWSASFNYIAMVKFWSWQTCVEPVWRKLK